MRKFENLLRMLLVGVFFAFTIAASATDPNVTIRVRQDDGTTAVSGVSASYATSSWYFIGVTDGTGTVSKSIPAGTYNFKVVYRGTSSTQSVTVSGDMTIDFYTTKVVVTTLDNAGSNLDGVSISYAGGSWYGIGSTSAGTVSAQLFPGSYDFRAFYRGTATTHTSNVLGDGISSGSTTNIPAFYTTKVNLTTFDDGGNNLDGASVSYASGSWYNVGSTVSGTVSAQLYPGSYNFKAFYRGTAASQTGNVLGDGVTGGVSTNIPAFYTTKVSINVSSCSGTNVPGVNLSYASGSWYGLGNTDALGNVEAQVFPGTYNFKAHYRGTSETQSVNVSGDGVSANSNTSVSYKPTTVTNYNQGSAYASGSWYSAYGVNYMFPGTYLFKINGYTTNVTISGCSKSFFVNILVLKDHNGDPLSGGKGRGGFGTNHGAWFAGNGAPTDANGVLLDFVNTNSAPTTMSYEMRFNNTTSVLTQDVSQPNGNVFTFQTIELRLRLETCGGTGLSGGTGRWGNGATYGTYYFPSPNSTDASGEMAAEWFPGTYSFEMRYQTTTNVKSSVTIPNANTKLTWQTTLVTLNWPYDIAYGGSGDSRFFNKPSMELLPGLVNFNFRSPQGSNYTQLNITGCNLTLTVGNVRLIDSHGNPLSGGEVSGYQGGWSNYGTTDANGNLLVFDKNPSSLAMKYLGGRQQKNGINFSVTPVVVFQTKEVTMEIKDHNGNYTLEADNLQYYASGWKVFGSGNTSGGKETMEMLPVKYSFALRYKGGRQQKNHHNVDVNPVVTFQTKEVTMEIIDHNGNHTLEADHLQYYASGWKVFGSGNTSGGVETMEMLPLKYSFAMKYKGGRQQKNHHDVDVNPVVTFQTQIANMYLLDYLNNPISGGIATYYASGWKSVGTTDGNGLASIELLPVSYSFRMSYAGKSNQQNHITVPADMYFTYNGSSITYSPTLPTVVLSRAPIGALPKEEPVVNELQIEPGVKIYPNPVNDQFKINVGSLASKSSFIRLFDFSGKMVVNRPIAIQQGQNVYTVDVSKLAKGVYMLMLGNGKKDRYKIVVMH